MYNTTKTLQYTTIYIAFNRYKHIYIYIYLYIRSFHTVLLTITVSMAVKHNSVLLNLITECLY